MFRCISLNINHPMKQPSVRKFNTDNNTKGNGNLLWKFIKEETRQDMSDEIIKQKQLAKDAMKKQLQEMHQLTQENKQSIMEIREQAELRNRVTEQLQYTINLKYEDIHKQILDMQQGFQFARNSIKKQISDMQQMIQENKQITIQLQEQSKLKTNNNIEVKQATNGKYEVIEKQMVDIRREFQQSQRLVRELEQLIKTNKINKQNIIMEHKPQPQKINNTPNMHINKSTHDDKNIINDNVSIVLDECIMTIVGGGSILIGCILLAGICF